MIVREVSLKVPTERQTEFASFWAREYRQAMSKMPGFLEARLLKHLDSDEELQLLLEFRSEEDAAAWRASPEHGRLGPKLKAFSPITSVRVLKPLG
jgi:heme-degrading monooxygenase HmoA